MEKKNKYLNRNRKKQINLAGLYAVPNEIAVKNGKPRDGVYGYITKDTPYICKAQSSNSKKPPQYVGDMTGKEVPKVLKNRMLAFWSDGNNKRKSICYLAEKLLYDEMKGGKRKNKSDNGSLW